MAYSQGPLVLKDVPDTIVPFAYRMRPESSLWIPYNVLHIPQGLAELSNMQSIDKVLPYLNQVFALHKRPPLHEGTPFVALEKRLIDSNGDLTRIPLATLAIDYVGDNFASMMLTRVLVGENHREYSPRNFKRHVDLVPRMDQYSIQEKIDGTLRTGHVPFWNAILIDAQTKKWKQISAKPTSFENHVAAS